MTKFLLDILIKALLVGCAWMPAAVLAQEYPSKPVRIIVPWPPSGNAALKKALFVESVRERYRSIGGEVMDMSQPEFASYVRADFEKWRALAKEGNIVIE